MVALLTPNSLPLPAQFRHLRGRVSSRRLVCYILVIFVLVYSLSRTWTLFTTSPLADVARMRQAEVPPDNGPDHNLVQLSPTLPRLNANDATQKAQEIDRQYCGQTPCRFLVPVGITEQESKAQMHFRQLAFLSKPLRRTIVLPNVSNSRLGICKEHPFSFYYSDAWMEQFSPKYFDYITMADFVRWLEERNAVESAPKPSSQDFFILANANNTFLDQNDSCLAHLTDPSGRPPIYTEIVDPENVARRKRNVTEHMLEVLGSRYNKFGEAISLGGGSDTDDTEVVNVFYDRRFPFIDNEDSLVPIAYSSKWHNIADTLANQLYPFIAVHWRMERLDPLSNLVPCAVSLVRAIDEIVQDQARNPYYPQIPNIFLLTDYPHLLDQGDTTESQSFKKSEIFQQHHDAIHYLYTHYPLHLTTFESPSTPPIPHDKLPANWTVIPVSHYPDVPDDASTLGIVDKLVAMNANWFIAGEAQVCGKRSSFTTRIIDEREQIYQQDESDKDIETSTQIMNVVDYFSIVGDEDMMLDDGE